jgi:hypothetical protein
MFEGECAERARLAKPVVAAIAEVYRTKAEYLLPMKPANKPKTIHARNDIANLLYQFWSCWSICHSPVNTSLCRPFYPLCPSFLRYGVLRRPVAGGTPGASRRSHRGPQPRTCCPSPRRASTFQRRSRQASRMRKKVNVAPTRQAGTRLVRSDLVYLTRHCHNSSGIEQPRSVVWGE